eukprot:scaffold139774_cov59-Attheya_sp.AAC.1
MSDEHPSVQLMVLAYLPKSHRDCYIMFRNPLEYPLPSWHPKLKELIARRNDGETLGVSIAHDHPDIDFAYASGEAMPNDHPNVSAMLKRYLPAGHIDVDMRLRSPLEYPLPEWHPKLNDMVEHRSFWSPGLIFTLIIFGALGLIFIIRVLLRLKANVKHMELYTCAKSEAAEIQPVLAGGATYMELNEELGDSLPRRRWRLHRIMKLNKEHRTEMYYGFEEVAFYVPRTRIATEKASSAVWSFSSKLMNTRIPKTQWTTGNALFCFSYLLANIVALFISPTYTIDRGLGSLAAANTIFLVISATRNSILTWFLGLAFDHIILYHRFLGRVTISIALLHFFWYFDRFLNHASEFTYWTGLFALLCGLGIVATTANWVRRNKFNAFFWSHYLFIGFFVFACMHVHQARPFLLSAIGFYALDKILRSLWTLLPQHTLVFQNRGDRTAQVQFAKNPLTRLMGRHHVGQYMFVNFPEISLSEWHPYSVSSGPDEDFVELHIRSLGDHTNKIVEFSKRCVAENRQPWIRSDGPYGYLKFNYRRYEVLMLAGGGIGITPIISMLKDIYGEKGSDQPHCIKHVYVVWVMPHAYEAELFLDMLLSCEAAALYGLHLPDITISVHCTRTAKEDVEAPLIAARPDFPSILDECTLRFPESSTLVFACGPGRMINQLWDESNKRNSSTTRVDFHHETFEF